MSSLILLPFRGLRLDGCYHFNFFCFNFSPRLLPPSSPTWFFLPAAVPSLSQFNQTFSLSLAFTRFSNSLLTYQYIYIYIYIYIYKTTDVILNLNPLQVFFLFDPRYQVCEILIYSFDGK